MILFQQSIIYEITRTLFRMYIKIKLTWSIASLPGTQIVGAAILKWMNSSAYRGYRQTNDELPNFTDLILELKPKFYV